MGKPSKPLCTKVMGSPMYLQKDQPARLYLLFSFVHCIDGDIRIESPFLVVKEP